MAGGKSWNRLMTQGLTAAKVGGEIVEQADDTRVNGGQGCTLAAE